jgi:hypothetical protein
VGDKEVTDEQLLELGKERWGQANYALERAAIKKFKESDEMAVFVGLRDVVRKRLGYGMVDPGALDKWILSVTDGDEIESAQRKNRLRISLQNAKAAIDKVMDNL